MWNLQWTGSIKMAALPLWEKNWKKGWNASVCHCAVEGWTDLHTVRHEKNQQGWWQGSSARFKDVESAIKPLPTCTNGEKIYTDTEDVKWLPSDSLQYLLNDPWCQHPINHNLQALLNTQFQMLHDSVGIPENQSVNILIPSWEQCDHWKVTELKSTNLPCLII